MKTVPTFKVCACGRHYTLGAFLYLKLCKSQDAPDGRCDYGGGELLEHRNCGCGSTIVVEVAKLLEGTA
jgi:hypothetical protein